MERLKAAIEQYGRWSVLDTYIERIEAYAHSDFSTAVENAKALLESIGKEICSAKGVELGSKPSINTVLKSSFTAMGYPSETLVTQISGALANIGQHMGNLRNEISPTSHGKSLEELEQRNEKVDELTREFLIDSTMVVAVFLIKAFESENPRGVLAGGESGPVYDSNEAFNEFWDDLHGEFAMGDYSLFGQ